MGTTKKQNRKRSYWLWVTGPEYYLAEDGEDRWDDNCEEQDDYYISNTARFLNGLIVNGLKASARLVFHCVTLFQGKMPEFLKAKEAENSKNWWTCHKETLRGDLILLYQTRQKGNIGYLIRAESDAYSIHDDYSAEEKKWDYGCEYTVLYKFRNPITLQELKNEPALEDWGALRGNFQRRVFPIEKRYWNKLYTIITQKEPTAQYRKLIKKIEEKAYYRQIILEEQLENRLSENLDILRKFDYHLELYIDAQNGINGRQVVCKGNGGRIDLLCYDYKHKYLVVIELKNVKAGQNVIGQISNYMGWVKTRIAKSKGRRVKTVKGLVISRGMDTKFRSSLTISRNIEHLNLKDLGFK